MATPRFLVYFCVYVAGFLHESHCDEDFSGELALPLQYSFDSGPLPEFVPRGSITINSLKSGTIQLSPTFQLSESEISKLRALASQDGLYRIRIPIKVNHSVRYLSTFLKACALYESGMRENLVLHRDANGDLVAISASTPVSGCTGIKSAFADSQHFNTFVEVKPIDAGPLPDTIAFAQKLEKEKERAKNEPQDNRSFFAKYWMYILPVVILIFVSGTSNAEQGAGR